MGASAKLNALSFDRMNDVTFRDYPMQDFAVAILPAAVCPASNNILPTFRIREEAQSE